MTEFRSRILQSKQHESSLIVTSRKRKLRELYAVADCDGPIPLNWVVVDIDHPPPSPAPSSAETLYLEKNDILQNRLFDESTLPARRHLQSYTPKSLSTSRRGVVSQTPDSTLLSSKAHRDDGSGKSRGSTPPKESGVGTASGSPRVVEKSRRGRSAAHAADNTTTGLRRTSSRSSQTKLPSSSDAALISSIEGSGTDDSQSPLGIQEEALEAGTLELDRIKNNVESRPSSPGIDPRKAIPLLPEDAANLPEPLIYGSHVDGHKAATAHLPPPEIQEDHLREVDEMEAEKNVQQEKDSISGSLSIKLPPPHNGRSLGDLVSSPGSTIDANSATTPAMHEASTDTSPDNDGPRYDGDRSDDKDPNPDTPSELALSNEEVREKAEHDRLLKAQIELARAEILASSPITADAQLRLEEEHAAVALEGETGREIPDSEKSGTESGEELSPEHSQQTQSNLEDLTHSAGEIVQDIIDDEDDEVVGVPTPEDEKVPEPEMTGKSPGPAVAIQIPDGDAMDIDSAIVEEASRKNSSKVPTVPVAVPRAAEDAVESSERSSVVTKDVSLANTFTTPRRTPAGPGPTSPTVERMTTRVSSGAMRHKSVSEILGEIPRPNTTWTSERNMAAKASIETDSITESNYHSRATTPQSPASRMRTMVERAKEKERSKLSTVVFAKQPADRPSSNSALVTSSAKLQVQESGDYFMPLILSQVYNATRGVQPLEALLLSAHKTITTSNAYIPYHEHQSHKIVRRIHSLQTQDKWSFRQPKRSPEPNRPTAHWDELLKEVKWMRTDFREERKWKAAVARNLARACSEWVEADIHDRKLLQVKAVIPPPESIQTNDCIASKLEVHDLTPEMESSAENEFPMDDFDEEPRTSLLDAVAPTAMFSLGDDDVIFGLRRSPATDKLLEELPMYGIPLKVPQSELPTSEVDPDALWRKPALPLSKYVEGKLVLKDDGPPRKKSRYEYEEEDENDEQVIFGSQGARKAHLQPAAIDVALFNPENKHIRDRIHAGHQFRPPSENPMPLQSFFECRSSSQWTWAEDDELKTLVREYSYNWQLISSMLSSRSLFASSAERRTPWECFERWIHLEGLPADMQKTHYFRAYNNRLEAAQRSLLAQAAQPPPQVSAAGAAITPVRRRTTTSVRVERRRNQKHLTLVDAMRKLAKKRETTLQKQQHAAGLAAMRKANEIPQPQGVKHTPQDFSRLKHEREVLMLERIQRHQMQQEAAKRAMQQGRNGQQPNPQQYANGAPQQARNIANPNAGAPINLPPNANRPNQLTVPGQNLPHTQMQPLPNNMVAQVPLPNGHGAMPQMPLKGVPQAPMQGMPAQHRMAAPNGAPDLRLVMQARQISEQQRQAIQIQQQGQNNQIHNSPPNMRASINMNGINQQAFLQNNQAMMAAFNAGSINGSGTPPANGLNIPSVPAGSPRMGHPGQPQQPNGSVSQISKLESQFRAQFPTASPEQVKKMVQDTLSQNLAVQRQSAMHAAAGSGTSLTGMLGGIQNSPQQYAQMLRAQQERQAAATSQQPRSSSAGSGSGIGK